MVDQRLLWFTSVLYNIRAVIVIEIRWKCSFGATETGDGRLQKGVSTCIRTRQLYQLHSPGFHYTYMKDLYTAWGAKSTTGPYREPRVEGWKEIPEAQPKQARPRR